MNGLPERVKIYLWIMFLRFGVLSLICMLFLLGKAFSQGAPVEYVDPHIGTQGLFTYGRTTPFVTPPFGMTHWTATTTRDRIGWPQYRYDAEKIRSFRGSHKPAMWMGDYGYVSIMPGVGKVKVKPANRALRFSHSGEQSTPYSYQVQLHPEETGPIQVEMTATARCGFFRIRFPHEVPGHLVVDACERRGFDGKVVINYADWEIYGWNNIRGGKKISQPLKNFRGYFVLQFNRGFGKYGIARHGVKFPRKDSARGDALAAYVHFLPDTTDYVEVCIGTSFISVEQARENLRHELPFPQFDPTRDALREDWAKYLNRIRIRGASHQEKTVFYTALYHSLLFPRQFSEYGQYYSPFDDSLHSGISYTDFSLWDTHRAQHPLLIFIAPEQVDPMMQSLVQNYEEGGYIPKWPNPGYTNIMIGTHADAVLADAYAKGHRGFDAETAYEAMKKNATVPSDGDTQTRWKDRQKWRGYEARGGLTWYLKNGFVPIDQTEESVSRTLEFAYDDFCVAQMAAALKKDDDFKLFLKRSENYRNVYNGRTGQMAPRNSDRSWYKKPNQGFTEGSPWTYLFAVQHDIPGLIDMMGKGRFIAALDECFAGGHYVHENEPGHHYAYLYNYTGQPWKTQSKVAELRREKYHATPDGLTGDDDCGQMSAWYVFSALGFYPVTPGTEIYALGTPQFPEVEMDLPNGKLLKILAEGVDSTHFYVEEVFWNGEKLSEPFIRHSTLLEGGILQFRMSDQPNFPANPEED